MATVADFLKEWDAPVEFIEAHTSGSTGTPKSIRLPKADMRLSARATIRFFGITAASTLALPLSVDYIAGKMMAVRARMAGCRLLELPVSGRIVLTEDVDLLAVVPSQVEFLIESGSISHVRNLLVGGAPLTPAQYAMIEGCGVRAFIGYGMTETCSHVALRRIGGGDSDSLYTAMPGITFDTDSRGCLVILSDGFSWRRLVTNDVVRLHGNTAFEWLGRADNVINSGGIKIHPEQEEAVMRAHIPGLPPFYLVGEPDGQWGSRLVMVAEARPGSLDLNRIKGALPDKRKAPRSIFYVDRLPVTVSGRKLRRLAPADISRTC